MYVWILYILNEIFFALNTYFASVSLYSSLPLKFTIFSFIMAILFDNNRITLLLLYFSVLPSHNVSFKLLYSRKIFLRSVLLSVNRQFASSMHLGPMWSLYFQYLHSILKPIILSSFICILCLLLLLLLYREKQINCCLNVYVCNKKEKKLPLNYRFHWLYH